MLLWSPNCKAANWLGGIVAQGLKNGHIVGFPAQLGTLERIVHPGILIFHLSRKL